MTQDDVIRLAVKCQLMTAANREGMYANALFEFAKLVAAHEREACAKVAGELHQRYLDTKDAHEKLSAKPFMPERFGFDHALIWNSQKMADAIRARGNT